MLDPALFYGLVQGKSRKTACDLYLNKLFCFHSSVELYILFKIKNKIQYTCSKSVTSFY